jgi:hypothetical protein
VTHTIRPRSGDLEAATHRHAFVPSGEYVGAHVEICDLCGLSFPSPMHDTTTTKDRLMTETTTPPAEADLPHADLYTAMDDLAGQIIRVQYMVRTLAKRASDELPRPLGVVDRLNGCERHLGKAHDATFWARCDFHDAVGPEDGTE